jgi:hypothetical protein
MGANPLCETVGRHPRPGNPIQGPVGTVDEDLDRRHFPHPDAQQEEVANKVESVLLVEFLRPTVVPNRNVDQVIEHLFRWGKQMTAGWLNCFQIAVRVGSQVCRV